MILESIESTCRTTPARLGSRLKRMGVGFADLGDDKGPTIANDRGRADTSGAQTERSDTRLAVR